MRIISGKFKGIKILFTNSSTTRPLRDYVRENIFNILTHEKNIKLIFENAKVLDLYSGVGSFGIECLSRNVDNVVFVEKDPIAYSILKKNIFNLKIHNKSKLISLDAKTFIENLKEKFDLIFLDPPYKDVSFIEIIKLIKKKKLFNKNHKIIIHRERKSEEILNEILKIDFIKNYGRSKIIFASF
ncbi:16S rRNA (guanine(966)-N(2))-methyltransferase RsmD [Pelagibacteraceae bacterium]|nr:16S rRNA (guanine(966)-N(2))-methyltransferase RsmD [Pelagibacteraceae bacterium]